MQSKPWYQSRTILSSIVGGILSLLAFFGYDFRSQSGSIVDAILQIAQVVVLLLPVAGAIAGRIKATVPVTPTLTGKPSSSEAQTAPVATAAGRASASALPSSTPAPPA